MTAEVFGSALGSFKPNQELRWFMLIGPKQKSPSLWLFGRNLCGLSGLGAPDGQSMAHSGWLAAHGLGPVWVAWNIKRPQRRICSRGEEKV